MIDDDRSLEKFIKEEFGNTAPFACESKGTDTVADIYCHWCNSVATQRAGVNIWGNVHVVPACDKCHKENHGKWRDDL